VQPGVILNDFQEEVQRYGLYYPPDPTEQNCFIGATVATNASGAKSFKYGPTRNYVESIRVILPKGDSISIERGKTFTKGRTLNITTENNLSLSIPLPNYNMPKIKHSAGYFFKEDMDAIDLFIGSEGTLGIITEIKLKLLDAPKDLFSAILFFDDESNALDFSDEIRRLSIQARKKNRSDEINARGIEFFDENSLKFIKEDFPQIPDAIKSAIWIEQEIDNSREEMLTNRWFDIAQNFNADLELSWFASDSADQKIFKNFRHAVSTKVNEFISNRGIRKVGTDTAVPLNQFINYYHYMIELVTKEGLKYVCYGHIGDCHLHLNMLPMNEKEYTTAKQVYSQLCKRATKLGGTISAEHGIGKLKRDYLIDMYGEENIKQMAEVKKSLDPNLILGIGNIFDPQILGL
ncbi:MAG: FAD-binding oxidoreductase, partial [Bacteroidota bacterium]